MHGRYLALKGSRRSRQNLEVLLDNVEGCAVINLGDAHEIAHLVLVLDFSDTLTRHQHTKKTALVVLWPFLSYIGAGVEEPSHGSSGGSDAANESKSGHVGMWPLPNSRTIPAYSYRREVNHNPQPQICGL